MKRTPADTSTEKEKDQLVFGIGRDIITFMLSQRMKQMDPDKMSPFATVVEIEIEDKYGPVAGKWSIGLKYEGTNDGR